MMALQTIPPPGSGGCHASLLGVANLGVMCGLNDHEIFTDIRNYIPAGTRHVPDNEITKTIQRARIDTVPMDERPDGWLAPKPPAATRNVKAEARLEQILKMGEGCGEADFFDMSPIELPPSPYHDVECYYEDLQLLLRHLYREDEYVFIGSQFDGRCGVQRVDDWLHDLKLGEFDWLNSPHIIANPLTGEIGTTKQGKPSYRADACVVDHRYAMVEFDKISKEKQYEFWAGIDLPLVAIIDSGGKSLHAWIKVDAADYTEWEIDVKGQLYRHVLEPFGVDSACKNPSRLSRTPGHFRVKNQNWQRLIYLAPQGRAMCRVMNDL
jgi:hypothetical protein